MRCWRPSRWSAWRSAPSGRETEVDARVAPRAAAARQADRRGWAAPHALRQGAAADAGRADHHPAGAAPRPRAISPTSLDELLESMHRALDAISLGTGEPAYFNGTGQMPHDLIVAVQAQSPARARQTGIAGGYGRLIVGPLDRRRRFRASCADPNSPRTPMPARWPSSSAMAATWWSAIAGRRRPAIDDALLFRQGIAHSAPTINALSAAAIGATGPAGRPAAADRRRQPRSRRARPTTVADPPHPRL